MSSHQSRLSTILIDCDRADFELSLEFWSRALGREPVHSEADPRYVSLRGRVGGDGGPIVLMQRTSAQELGMHIDIESDDVEAEVARLEKLGARIKRRVDQHVVMTAPSGHAFCVVPVHRSDFPAKAVRWGDQGG